jgi:hypothetical protein
MSPEQEFEQRLDVHRRDSKSCAIFLYTLLTTHTLAGSDFGLFDRVNAHAGFWNGTLAGLQAAAYIALGRIYDPNDSNYNALALLAYTKEHFGIFSRSALQARKIRVGMSPDDAMRYVSQAFEEYEPKRTDLAPLQSALNEQREVYVTKVQPIRHEVFAHSGRLTPEDRDRLFAKPFDRELERLVVFALQLHDALFQFCHNGTRPQLRDAPSNVVEMLRDPVPPNTSTWEQRHVVTDTAKFLASLGPHDNAT